MRESYSGLMTQAIRTVWGMTGASGGVEDSAVPARTGEVWRFLPKGDDRQKQRA
jgi:hypothetical protein